MICSFHFNNLFCVLPARQSSSIIISCNIDCFKKRVKRVASSLLKFTNFHNLSTNKNNQSKHNNNHENRINFNPLNKYNKFKQVDYLLTLVYIFMCIAALSISCPKVSATSSSSSSSSSDPWSQSNRYFLNNNNNNKQQFLQSSSSSTLINDRNRLKQSPSILKYSGPYYRPPSSPSTISKYNQRINNTNNVWTRKFTNNHGDNISSPSRIINSGDTIIPTSLSTSLSSFPIFSSIPSSQSISSSVHFPFDESLNNNNGQVNGYISVASSILPETLYQKTLKRQSSSASSLNGLYTLDERNNSSNSPSPSLSSSSSSLSSSLTSSSLSIQPSTPLTLNHIPSPQLIHLQSSPQSSSTTMATLQSPSESPLISSSSPSPYLPSSSPTPSSLSATTLGYHLTEDRYTSIDIRDLLRKELDERVMEQQKAKQPHYYHHNQPSQSTPLPSSSVNLFALLPPKRDDLDRLASNTNRNTGNAPISSVSSPSSSSSSSNRINGITNGHSRSPPGINILVFKPNSPVRGSSDGSSETSSSKNWGETFGLPPRIPLKPGGYPNDPKTPPITTDSKNKIVNYHRGSGSNNFNLKHHNNDGFRVYSDKEGEHFGINYINRNDENSGSSIPRNKPSSSTTSTTTSTSTIQPITTKTNVTTLLAVGGSGNNVIKKIPDTIDYSSNDFNNNHINTNHNGINNNDRSGGSNSGHRPSNNHDRYDYDYDGHGIPDANGTSTILSESNGSDDAFVNGEAYRLTTERLAYILIGSCCALSILCLIIVAFSIRCRDMCDEYKAWKKAEKLAMLNYRYQNSHARQRIRSGIPGAATTSGLGVGARVIGGPEANFFSHRALGEQDSNLSYPPIKASRPIFGPSCCCCPAPGSTGSAWHGRGTETCPRGYFHPCPRGKLPFGAASSIQAFPRNHVPVAAVTNNFPSDEDDSLNASIVDDGRPGPSGVTVTNAVGAMDPKGVILDSNDAHHGQLNQCTCVEPPTPSTFEPENSGQPSNRHHSHHHGHHSHGQSQQQPSSSHHNIHHQHVHQQQQQQRKQQLNNGQTNGENDKSFNPSWLQSSIIVDELHRKHSQLVRENAKSPKNRTTEDQRYIFWSENQDRLI